MKLSKNYTTIRELSIILKLHRYLTWGSLVERAESVMLLFIVLYRIELASLTFLSQFIFCRVTHSGSSHKSNSFEIDTHVTDQSWCSAISSLFVSLSLRSWKCYKFHFLSIHIHGILKAFFCVRFFFTSILYHLGVRRYTTSCRMDAEWEKDVKRRWGCVAHCRKK